MKTQKIKSSEFQRIVDIIDIVEVIGRETKLTKSGPYYKGCCPFHKESTPSFIVNPKDCHTGAPNKFHCFGGQCGEHGNVIDFIQKYYNMESMEALEYLSKMYNVPLQYEEYELSAEDIRLQYLYSLNSAIVDFLNQNLINQAESSDIKKYLNDRYITNEDIIKWKIGYGSDEDVAKNFICKNFEGNIVEFKDFIDLDIHKNNFFTNKIIFPIFDVRGRPVAFSNRIFAYHEDKSVQLELEKKKIETYGKYNNTGIRQQGYDGIEYGSLLYKSKSSNLYGLHLAKQNLRKNNWTLILVEGNVDTVACHRYGINNLAGLLGTAFNEDTIQLIKSCGIKKVIFCLDGDKGGEGGVKRVFEKIQRGLYKEDIDFIINAVMLPEGHDPDTFLAGCGDNELLLSLLDKPKCISEFLIDVELYDNKLETLSEKINFINDIKKKLTTNRVLSSLEKKLIVESLSLKLGIDKDTIAEYFKIEENKTVDSIISDISERIVISELIFSDESRVSILNLINLDNYFYSKNKKIHELVAELHSTQQPIDLNVIEIKSRELGYLNKYYDLEYLKLLRDTPRVNVEFHINKIIELFKKRVLLNIGKELETSVFSSDNMQELIGNASSSLYKLNFNKEEDIFKEPKQEAIDYFKVMAERLSNPGNHYGIKTGFPIFDEATQGLFPGQTILILARTSDGKTALAQNFARNISLQDPSAPLYYANLEMPSQDMMDRVISIDSGVPIRKICSGHVSERQKSRILKSIENYGNRGTFHIQYVNGLTISKLSSILRYQKEVNKIKIAIVDYFQLMSPDKDYIRAARAEQLAAISKDLTGLAKVLNIPIIIVAQANRTTVTDNAGRPELHHVFGTDQLAHDVDIAISLQPQTKGQMEKNGGFLAPDEMKCLGYGHLIIDNPDDYEKHKIGRNGNYMFHILKNRKGQKDFSYPIFFHKFKIKFQECSDCMKEIQSIMNNS